MFCLNLFHSLSLYLVELSLTCDEVTSGSVLVPKDP